MINKVRVKLVPGSVELENINYFECEGISNEELDDIYEINEMVVIFPIKKTKNNVNNYNATLFHIITKTGCNPLVYDDFNLCFRFYTISKKLELAINYDKNSNDWNDCIVIDEPENEEIEFIRNWFVTKVDNKIEKFASTYKLSEDNYLCCNLDIFNMKNYVKWYEKENSVYKFTISNLFYLDGNVNVSVYKS
ncbi:hypothetical protein KQI61_15325 [Anaerocolumna aminovalerica]|uniref:hypothetical protein n=1 Tax=Anaerocolumna aminovalerica TaxID=1527 RepID=UPI001C0E9A1E|nr:hypothetical protein [Anaerocolumna aminovalerica]MBU5333569.1 hypothetical protein [Anaerocolumna aminovalerica]